MEEHVGQYWHKLITRAASRQYPQAAVQLVQVRNQIAVLFRALGGDPALRVDNTTATAHKARRSWLQRLAGSGRQVELAWRDGESLRLPDTLALFASPALNRDLYIWLAALAAVADDVTDEVNNNATHNLNSDWFSDNQRWCAAALARFPGLQPRYQKLLAALLQQRIEPSRLPAAEAAAEQALRQALQTPGSVAVLPASRRPPQPVYLWLHPAPPSAVDRRRRPTQEPTAGDANGSKQHKGRRKRRRAERVDDPDGQDGLLAFRLESLFSWTEYVAVDRTSDDSDDPDSTRVADDLEVLSIARSGDSQAAQVRFDLDLPASSNDDQAVGTGIPLPEWDYRKQQLITDYCHLQPLLASQAPACELPLRLRRSAQQLRQRFALLAPLKSWRRRQLDGCEIDLDAWLQHASDQRRGQAHSNSGLYRAVHHDRRDLACLLLADLSLSTDTWVDNRGRVIDVIRDSLFLFSEALSASRDAFALYGFSSRRNTQVRFNILKTFDETYNDQTRGRIQAISPGYYTRMGAAIRYAGKLLAEQPAERRLLLLLTDGKPNDLDRYEGRYGAEDTRMAVIEARRLGLQVFCVTIDDQAEDYLPHLFGRNGFVLLRHANELPRRLPQLYWQLTS